MVPNKKATTQNSKESVPNFVATVDLLREGHIAAAWSSINDPEILRELEGDIERDCAWL
jgi:aspartate kinase